MKKPRPRPAILAPLGAQLRRLRLDRQMSQEALAERSGLNYKYIGRVELGKAEPGADVLVRLARALSVPIGDLFETILPPEATPSRLSPAEVEALTTSLAGMTAAVNRVLTRQPATTAARAPRRPSR